MKLYPHQAEAINKLEPGSILYGGVGSGKTLTSLAYFIVNICSGGLQPRSPMKNPMDIYVITTARKRDSLDWEEESAGLGLTEELSETDHRFTVDSWNNIAKYKGVKSSFFIFDEQKLIGSGLWVKSFLEISKNNKWIILSATPGDTWVDYIPVFIANGFYKNRSAFMAEHVVFDPYVQFPKIKKYLNEDKLAYLKNRILVAMPFKRTTNRTYKDIQVVYDDVLFKETARLRFNPYKHEPILNPSEFYHTLLRITNSHPSRLDAIIRLTEYHRKIIVFYSYDYELEALRSISLNGFETSEWNGKYHQEIPKSDKWLYFVQYVSGSEAWNCIETNAIVFYSQVDSYKLLEQARGRIDRLNTPFSDLYYYTLISTSPLDLKKKESLENKKDFSEREFVASLTNAIIEGERQKNNPSGYSRIKSEKEYQPILKKNLQTLLPGVVVLKNDPTHLSGIPDLTLLYKDKWAAIEVKKSGTSRYQPNQKQWLEKLDKMSFARTIHPNNEKDVSNELKDHFGI